MTSGRRRLVLPLAAAGSFLVIMDATIVAVALPAMGAELGISPEALPWVVNAYTLTFAGFLLLGGRIADLVGVRRALAAGLVVFGVASLAGGLAVSAAMVLAARAVQGIGGAVLLPATLAAITATLPAGDLRTRALAMWSMVGAVGATAGTLIGGMLTQWVGWRWVLLIGVPPALVAAALVPLALAPPVPGLPRARLDWVGAVLATGGLTAIVYGIMQVRSHGPLAPDVVVGIGGGVSLVALFAVHQRRWARYPLLPPGTFALPGVRAGNLVMFLTGLAFFATPVLLVLALQRTHGYSAALAGVAFVPVALALLAGGRLAGPLTVRFGVRTAAAIGLAGATVGFAALAVGLGTEARYPLGICVPGVLLGLGTGAAFTPITVAVTHGVPAGRHGLAAGLLNTTRQVSGALGLAILSAISLTVGDGAAMAVAAVSCAAALACSRLLPAQS